MHFIELLWKGVFLFYDQLLKLCENAGIKPTTLITNLGMSKGSMANWKAGKLPSGEALVRFSEHFDVSLDYLVYGREKSTALSAEDVEWLSLIHRLPRDAQLEFKGELKGYIKGILRDADSPEKLREAK